MIVNVNGKPAVRINAIIKGKTTSGKAYLVDTEEKKLILPISTVRDNKDGTIDVQEWIYKQKIEL